MFLEKRSTAASPLSHRAPSAASPACQRARRTNNPLADVNLNTARGRRIADLTRSYLAALGNPADAGRQAAIIAAAELQVLAEEARAAALSEPGVADLEMIIRMQGAADRALRRLGIKSAAGPKPLSLRERLLSEAAAR